MWLLLQALRRLSPHQHIIKLMEVLYDQPTGRLALVFELMDMNIYELIRYGFLFTRCLPALFCVGHLDGALRCAVRCGSSLPTREQPPPESRRACSCAGPVAALSHHAPACC